MRSEAITRMSAAIPLKMAPVTKYGPKMVLCHMGAIAMAKSHATTVWTETATARMMQAHQLHGALEGVPLAVAAHPAEREQRGRSCGARGDVLLAQLRQIRDQRQIQINDAAGE